MALLALVLDQPRLFLTRFESPNSDGGPGPNTHYALRAWQSQRTNHRLLSVYRNQRRLHESRPRACRHSFVAICLSHAAAIVGKSTLSSTPHSTLSKHRLVNSPHQRGSPGFHRGEAIIIVGKTVLSRSLPTLDSLLYRLSAWFAPFLSCFDAAIYLVQVDFCLLFGPSHASTHDLRSRHQTSGSALHAIHSFHSSLPSFRGRCISMRFAVGLLRF